MYTAVVTCRSRNLRRKRFTAVTEAAGTPRCTAIAASPANKKRSNSFGRFRPNERPPHNILFLLNDRPRHNNLLRRNFRLRQSNLLHRNIPQFPTTSPPGGRLFSSLSAMCRPTDGDNSCVSRKPTARMVAHPEHRFYTRLHSNHCLVTYR